MGEIGIVAPGKSLYVFGCVAVHDMVRRTEICRCSQGEMMRIPAEAALELGIAWGRGSTPPVKLRFIAEPEHVYRLFWLWEGFGAGMGAEDITRGLP